MLVESIRFGEGIISDESSWLYMRGLSKGTNCRTAPISGLGIRFGPIMVLLKICGGKVWWVAL